jgi:hypothetical protein
MKERRNIYVISLLSALIMCSLAMPAMADYNANGWPVETRVNGTVNGGVFHDSIGWTEATTQTLVTDVPNGTVKYAYLYTGIWGGHSTGWMNVTFNGDYTNNKLGPIHLEETSDSNDNVWCTGQGKYWLWYNVTNLTNAGQINTATTSKINGSIDGRVYGIVLVVVYEGGDNPKQIQYWINDGSDALKSNNPTGTTDFNDTVSTAHIAMANLTMVHLTGYDPICDECMQFNGNILNTSGVNTNEFDMHTWNVTNYMEASGNDAWFSRGSDAYVNICNAILTVEYEPDLNVTNVLVNPGDERYEGVVRVYVNQSNNISAVVHNNGPGNVAGDFDVCFEADGVKIGCATVTGGLSAGANTTVSIDWTPNCANYPVMPGFPAQSLPLTINVTVDCNCSNCPTCPDGSCGTITETDETNNIFSKVIPAMQVCDTRNVIGGVVNNGYKSKNFDCDTTEEPLDQFKYYNLIGGGVEYNVSGVKISSFDPEATDTRIHHIDLPSGATVKDARLYVYWYDKWGNYKTYPTGCLANLNVNFNGTDLMPDVAYQDSKAFGYYQSPKGSSAFNVTSLVSGSGDYIAIVKNIEPIAGNSTTLLGEMLVVVYEGADHGYEVQIWMLEGTDYLMAADDTHGSKNFSVSPEEATATVAFSGVTIDLANVNTARLITVVAQGMSLGSDLLFNGNVIKTDAWDTPTEVSLNSKINAENISVKSNLLASGNNMGFRDNGTTGMQASNAILIVYQKEAIPLPDLNVTDVLVNPGGTRDSILRVYVNQSNNISAVVHNNGPGNVAGDFDVCFEADGVKIGCATVTGGLSAGANTTVSIDWTPTCVNYPVMPGFPPQSLPLTINVTVDCNCNNCPTCPDGSCGTISETDETNNTFSKVIPAMQVYSTYNVIGGVVNNGYKSKNFDCGTTEEPLDQFEYYNLIGGGVEYNVSGAKISTFAPQATDSRVHHIDLPSSAIVKDARLYVYWQDKWGNYKTYPTGCLANLNVNFNGTDLMPDVAYQDSKAFGYYQSPKGSSAFNVTSLVSGSGDYTAIVKNIEPIAGNSTTLLGEMLVVVYDGADHGREVQIWMLEGTDYLMAADDTHGSYDFSVSPEEATATVALDGSINLATIDTARLIAVVAQGMSTGSDMLFNGNVIKTDAWGTSPSSEINVENVSVMSNLLSSSNNMGFRDNGTGGMQASNAFLIVEYKDEALVEIDLGDDQDTEVGRHIMVPITANDLDQFYGTVEMNLNYGPANFDFVAIHSSSDSIVTACQDYSSEGILDISAWNKDGVRGDVVLATVELEVVDGAGSDETLSLTVDLFEDVYGGAIDCYAVPTTISIKNLAGDLAVSSTAMPTSNLGDTIDAILNSNGRLRHTGDDAIVISATVTDSGLGIQSVTVDLSSIGGSANALMSEIATGEFELTTTATAGINDAHTFVVTAKDNGGNTADDTTNSLTVYRRGDVMRNNKVDMGDAMYIARYTVGLESPDMDHFKFVGDVQPASDSDHTTNMADALFIARYTVGLEPAP